MDAGCHKKNKERLQKKDRERYQNLPEEEKSKHQYAFKQYRNLSEYRKKYSKMWKNKKTD